MVLSAADGQSRPSLCRCGKPQFHRHARYWRFVAMVWVYRFLCITCRTTVSMVPSTCVPYKRHPVQIINPVLDGMFEQERSGRYFERDNPHGIHGSTAHRWRREFTHHAGILGTEGALRLGMAPLTGAASDIYQAFKQRFSSLCEHFFTPLQLLLCGTSPPLGIFRPLLF